VGIGGLTLGGGIGFLARRDGLTVDQLLAAEMITVDGRRVTASAEEHPDLFWALRGGGGNFGVVPDLRFRMRPAGPIYGGWLILPATREVIQGAVAASISAPDALTTIINVMRLPALPGVPAERVGELAVVITAAHSGGPKRTGPAAGGLSATDLHAAESAFRPLRALDRPILDRVGVRPYRELFGFFNEVPVPARRASVRRNTFLDRLDDALIDTILDFTSRAPSLAGTAQLRVLGGAVSRVPADATAYAHRDRPILLMLYTDWEAGSDPAPNHDWIERFWAMAGPHGSGAYVGFLSGDEPSDVHAAYPDPTYARLAAVKRSWDPTNRLRLNHNIQPGPEPSPGRSPV
jgi:FAD/FMN-containing dehydrogenase